MPSVLAEFAWDTVSDIYCQISDSVSQTASFAQGPDGERFRKVCCGATTVWLGPANELLPDGTLLEQAGALGRAAWVSMRSLA
jgi:hypothetical protein